MPTAFDSSYHLQPFSDLCANFPGPETYDPKDFRVEWGPIFHRGRLDGSARVLLIGQDPAQHETILRRILVGTAGRRTQGFLAKLGITKSYVMINAFLYSVYGQGGGEAHKDDPGIVAYRNKWIKSILSTAKIEIAISLGGLANGAWAAWLKTPEGKQYSALPYQHITHPTWPESSGHSEEERRANTKIMLGKWNTALNYLHGAVKTPDVATPLVPYGDAFAASDLGVIPPIDLPAGLPAWMRSDEVWATREGANAEIKRRTIKVVVPTGIIPAGSVP